MQVQLLNMKSNLIGKKLGSGIPAIVDNPVEAAEFVLPDNLSDVNKGSVSNPNNLIGAVQSLTHSKQYGANLMSIDSIS